MRTHAAWILLALGGLLGTGCTPTVQLKSAVLQGADFQGARFDAILALDNPNAFDIQVKTVRANAYVGDIKTPIPVYYEAWIWIPAHRKVNLRVPVNVPWGFVPGLLSETAGSDKVPYTIIGRADVVATRAFAIDRDDYAFNEDGEVPRNLFIQSGGPGGLPITIGVGTPTAWRLR